MQKNTNIISKLKNHPLAVWMTSAVLVSGVVMSNAVVAFADPDGNSLFQKTISNVVSMITSIAMGVGIILIVVGVIQMLLSLLRDDGERQANATKFLVVGIALLAINGFLKAIGVNSTDTIKNLKLWSNTLIRTRTFLK